MLFIMVPGKQLLCFLIMLSGVVLSGGLVAIASGPLESGTPCVALIENYGKELIHDVIVRARDGSASIEVNGQVQDLRGKRQLRYITPRSVCSDILALQMSLPSFSSLLENERKERIQLAREDDHGVSHQSPPYAVSPGRALEAQNTITTELKRLQQRQKTLERQQARLKRQWQLVEEARQALAVKQQRLDTGQTSTAEDRALLDLSQTELWKNSRGGLLLIPLLLGAGFLIKVKRLRSQQQAVAVPIAQDSADCAPGAQQKRSEAENTKEINGETQTEEEQGASSQKAGAVDLTENEAPFFTLAENEEDEQAPAPGTEQNETSESVLLLEDREGEDRWALDADLLVSSEGNTEHAEKAAEGEVHTFDVLPPNTQSEYAALLGQIRAALSNQDRGTLTYTAHRLKGVADLTMHTHVYEAVCKLEQLGLRGDLAGASVVFQELVNAIDMLGPYEQD